jgi:chaperone LolA
MSAPTGRRESRTAVATRAGQADRTRHATLLGGITTALALALAAPAANVAAQDRGGEVIDEAALLYEGVDTLCAEFVQTLEIPLLGDEHTGSGRVCQARPNLFAMRFTDPIGDAVVADGEAVWVYFPSSDPRTVVRAGPDRAAGGHDFHREFLVDTEEKYAVTYEAEDRVGDHATHRLQLVPRGPASYRSATVWIDRGEPVLRQVRIEEENGNVRTITLENVDFRAAPAAGWFTFTPPAGARVIEG